MVRRLPFAGLGIKGFTETHWVSLGIFKRLSEWNLDAAQVSTKGSANPQPLHCSGDMPPRLFVTQPCGHWGRKPEAPP